MAMSSKPKQDGDNTQKRGLMMQAAAYRAKYCKRSDDGKAMRVNLRVENSGVHKKNRGSVYPSGQAIIRLCKEVTRGGFLKEEVDHAAIAVGETPIESIRSRGDTM